LIPGKKIVGRTLKGCRRPDIHSYLMCTADVCEVMLFVKHADLQIALPVPLLDQVID